MKKLICTALCLVLLVSIFSALPTGLNAQAEERITVPNEWIYLYPGAEYTLRPIVYPPTVHSHAVTFSSSDPNIIRVYSDGRIRAVGNPGQMAAIVIRTLHELELVLAVNILIPVQIAWSAPTSKEMVVGESYRLVGGVYPLNANNNSIGWESSNPSVASVDQGGLVSAHGVGTAEIRVISECGGHVGTSSITVRAPQPPSQAPIVQSIADEPLLEEPVELEENDPIVPYLIDETSGTTVTGDNIPYGAILNVEQDLESTLEIIQENLIAVDEREYFLALLSGLNITLTDIDGDKVEPSGAITVSVPTLHFAEEYLDEARVYHIDDDGEYILLSFEVYDNYITFEADTLGVFAVVRLDEDEEVYNNGEIDNESGGIWWVWTVVGVVVLGGGGAAAWYFIFKKKPLENEITSNN